MQRPTQPGSQFLYQIQQIVTVIFLIYVLFLIGRSAHLNAQGNRRIEELRQSIEDLKVASLDLASEISYRQTAGFQEIEAREKLGLKKPGEFVIIVPKEHLASDPAAAVSSSVDTRALLEIWWEYYFGS